MSADEPRQFRVPDDLWDRFEEAALNMGKPRAAILRDFISWYIREPGTRMPHRPPVRLWRDYDPPESTS